MYFSQGIAMKFMRFACDRCHRQKLRCPRSTKEGGSQKPCVRCQKAGTSCTVTELQKTGRPRKKAKVTSPKNEARNDHPPPAGDSADSSTISQPDMDCEADATPQSTTESRTRFVKGASVAQRHEEFTSPLGENPVNSSESYPFASSLDDYTSFLMFDNSFMDMPDVVDEQIFSSVEGGVPQESDKPVDIFTFSNDSMASGAPKDNALSREESLLSKDPESVARAQDIHLAQASPIIWERLHEDLSKSTSYTDLSPSIIKSRPLSPVTLNKTSPQSSPATVYQNCEIHEAKNGKRTGSPHPLERQEPCGSMVDHDQFVETPSLLDIGLSSTHKGTQALLQIQFEIYTCSSKFLSLKTVPNRCDSADPLCDRQSETLGKFFSTADTFILLISESQSTISASSSPRPSAPSASTHFPDATVTALETTEHFAPWTLSRILKPTSTVDDKPSRSTFDVPVEDPAVFHLLLACHTRLITAYEAIIDAIAAQSQRMGNGNTAAGPVASLSIGGFTIQCGNSLESNLHLQIILHQLDRLSDACYAYLSRAHAPDAREDAFCFNSSLRGLHERRRRAAPATLSEMAKRMVEEREMALRKKIKSLAQGPHHALDMDTFYYADDAS